MGSKAKKYVYSFGGGKADGNESMKNLLGGKGANLAEMAGHPKLRLPVPPGFTLSTDVCTYYYKNSRSYPKELKTQVDKLQLIMAGVDTEKIKNSDNLKADIVKSFSEASGFMSNLPEVKGRKIRA